MNPYPLVPLGDVLHLDLDPVTVRTEVIYDIAGVLGFGRGLFRRSPIAGSETSYKVLHRLHAGTLVLSRLKAFEGAIALVGDDFDGLFLSPEFPTFSCHPDRLESAYLKHLCRWPSFWDRLSARSKEIGARRERVHPEQLLAITVPIPNVDEQRRVAVRLDGLLSATRKIEARLAEDGGGRWLAFVPSLIDEELRRHTKAKRPVSELVEIVSDVVHPGDDVAGAREFVGLQHVEGHSGRCIGSDPIGDETGRKFRFKPDDILYGYLRPYLNKVWRADRDGLCSVDQYVLRPRAGIDGTLLGFALRSRAVLNEAIAMTHNLQLPRLRSGLLSSIQVQWPEDRDVPFVRSRLESLAGSMLAAVDARRRQVATARALTPSILNRAFAGLL